MKKTIVAMGILLISFGISTTAYAGTINSYEQDVLSAAQGTFRYNGEDYRLDSSYISQLRDYLAQDSVDLTASDRDTVIQAIGGYVEQGVQQGYLKPINGSSSGSNSSGSSSGGGSTGDNSSSGSTGNNGGSSTGNSGSTSGDIGQGSVPGQTGNDNSGTGNNTSDGNQTQNNNTQDSGSSNSGQVDPGQGSQANPSTPGSSLEDLLNQWKDEQQNNGNSSMPSSQITNGDGNTGIDNSDSSVSSVIKDESVDKNAPVIKETGFDLSLTLAMIILFGVIMTAGIGITVRNHYFGESDE